MELIIQIFERTKTEINTAAICSTAGACLSFLVGGFDAPVVALLLLIIADYATGMLAAWKTGTISSQRGYRGLMRKIAIVGVVALANLLDVGMGLNHLLRSMTVCGYCGMEGISLLENIDRAGCGEYIPPFLRAKLIQLRDEKGLK